MAINRLDNVGIVVDDLDAAIGFFQELGMELEGTADIEGSWADQSVGLDGIRCEIAMLRTPDGQGRLELCRYRHPEASPFSPPDPPHNIVGMHRVMFEVDDLVDTVERLRPHGGALLREIANYQDVYRLCYLRGPSGIIVGLAEKIG
ncbi:VOC family protein [Agromyces sp. G08B096]|uniref:VOC family protein n=1 Tax=Agromyces sp. G08B096 TaxID=3156399 RepID=A0AAU7W4L5_9MICO